MAATTTFKRETGAPLQVFAAQDSMMPYQVPVLQTSEPKQEIYMMDKNTVKTTNGQNVMFDPRMFPDLYASLRKESNKKVSKKSRKSRKSKKIATKVRKSHKKNLKNVRWRTIKERRAAYTGSFVQVFRGTKKYTKGGLMKKDLLKNKKGRVVSKKQQKNNPLKLWVTACQLAKKELNIPGFCTLNRGAKGIKLYKRAKKIYTNLKAKTPKVEGSKRC